MESPGIALFLLGLLIVAALVLVNAYFVAAEFSLVAVRRSQVKLWIAEGRRGARAVWHAVEGLDDAIAATQLGITAASIGLGWVGEPVVAGLLEPALARAGLGHVVAVHTVAVAVSFAFITFLHVVAGELAPKALALDSPGRVALVCARPLLLFARLFRPLLALMNGTGNALVRSFGVKPAGGAQRIHSPEELSLLVSEAHEAGVIRPDTGRMLGNVFRLGRTRVHDVMIPREQVIAVSQRVELEELLDLLREKGYTRLPVYADDLDDVVGVLHAKDLFHVYAERRLVIMADVIRPVAEMDPDLPVVDALRQFRRGRRHLAVVRRAHGPLLGIVTLEDVLEEIVGEIEDEHDEPTLEAVD